MPGVWQPIGPIERNQWNADELRIESATVAASRVEAIASPLSSTYCESAKTG